MVSEVVCVSFVCYQNSTHVSLPQIPMIFSFPRFLDRMWWSRRQKRYRNSWDIFEGLAHEDIFSSSYSNASSMVCLRISCYGVFFLRLIVPQWRWMDLMINLTDTRTDHWSLAQLGLIYLSHLILFWLPSVHRPGYFYWIVGEQYFSCPDIGFWFYSRAERRKNQVCSSQEYQKVFKRLQHLPQNVEHLVVLVGKSTPRC
jgi:hypothetical protein